MNVVRARMSDSFGSYVRRLISCVDCRRGDTRADSSSLSSSFHCAISRFLHASPLHRRLSPFPPPPLPLTYIMFGSACSVANSCEFGLTGPSRPSDARTHERHARCRKLSLAVGVIGRLNNEAGGGASSSRGAESTGRGNRDLRGRRPAKFIAHNTRAALPLINLFIRRGVWHTHTHTMCARAREIDSMRDEMIRKIYIIKHGGYLSAHFSIVSGL